MPSWWAVSLARPIRDGPLLAGLDAPVAHVAQGDEEEDGGDLDDRNPLELPDQTRFAVVDLAEDPPVFGLTDRNRSVPLVEPADNLLEPRGVVRSDLDRKLPDPRLPLLVGQHHGEVGRLDHVLEDPAHLRVVGGGESGDRAEAGEDLRQGHRLFVETIDQAGGVDDPDSHENDRPEEQVGPEQQGKSGSGQRHFSPGGSNFPAPGPVPPVRPGRV